MNIDKILDIRFLAPVGIMLFFIFLFSPESFLLLVSSQSDVSWIVSIVGVLGIGFMISSVTEFYIRWRKKYLGEYKYELKELFHLEKVKREETARELATWIVLDTESKRTDKSGIPDQIHKRWNMAMANFNAALGAILGLIIAYSLVYSGKLQFPACFGGPWSILLSSVFLFLYSGAMESERAVRY